MRKYLSCGIALFFLQTQFLLAQFRPSVVVQSGFSNDIGTHFRFSHKNNFLYAVNDVGEFILWELRSGKQVRKFTPMMTEFPTMYYIPRTNFSDDEKYIMIPEFPKGNYLMYDVQSDKIVRTFTPRFPDERYTQCIFSEDGTRLMMVAQVSGDNPYCRIETWTIDGKLEGSRILNIPKVVETDNEIILFLMKRMLNNLKLYPMVAAVAASPDLNKIWLAPAKGDLYALNLKTAPTARELNEADYIKIALAPHLLIISELNADGDKIIAKRESAFDQLKDNSARMTDSLFIVDKNTNQLERKVVSDFYLMREPLRANSATTTPLSTGYRMNTYFKASDKTPASFNITCRDLLSNNEIFTYKFGAPVRSYTNGTYLPGQLNGGFIVAISDDQSLIAECTGDLVIHDVRKKQIKTFFPLLRGNLKLNTPVFLDSNRLFIPKTYSDAFVFNLKSITTQRLKKEIDCQDTARLGQNVFNLIDNTAQIGMQNSALSADKKTVAMVNFIPNDLCSAVQKTIDVYDAKTLKQIEQYNFKDAEYSYFFGMIPSAPKKFMVNHKLFDFENPEKYAVKQLVIVQKRDTFFAVNPAFIPSKNFIFGMCATRKSPGSPDLIFAQWDLNGKLIKSFKYERKKSKLEYQTTLLESQLSPDSSQLMFGLGDGTAGIFNIESMTMGPLFEHGKALEIKLLKYYGHITIESGCFIDKDHFVTNGTDGQINLWSISEKKLVKVINKEPLILYGLVLSPDKRHLVATNMDKSILFINIATGEIDLRFVAFDYESYAVIDKDGFYTGNKKSAKDLNFFYQSRSYDFSQFDLYLNRPDKIMERMGYATPAEVGYYRKAYEKRLTKLGYKPNNPPQLVPDQIPAMQLLGLPENIRETADPKIAFSISAVDNRYAINKVFVSVNGIPLYGVKGLDIKAAKPGAVNIPVSVPLSSGKNNIEISVMNSNGAQSLTEFLTVTKTGAVIKPDLYFVSVGSGTFAQATKNLKYPAKDSKDLVDLFGDQAANFGKITNIILQNEKVTKVNLFKIRDQLKKTKPEDMVILFFAGHGILDKNLDYYLSTYNTDFTNPSLQAIAYQDLEGLMDSIPARNRIMLIDACNSGEVDKENAQHHVDARTSYGGKVFRTASARSVKEVNVGPENSFALMQSLFSDLRRSTGTSVISAASAYENAVESDQWQNGVFTYCLKKGLKEKKADLNKDGRISLSELLEYLNVEVSLLTEGSQQPTSRVENIINDPIIWR